AVTNTVVDGENENRAVPETVKSLFNALCSVLAKVVQSKPGMAKTMAQGEDPIEKHGLFWRLLARSNIIEVIGYTGVIVTVILAYTKTFLGTLGILATSGALHLRNQLAAMVNRAVGSI
uniref:Uncharacterized protein n=1 Tax=Hyaloperonospora arabidopsidis (strain Emoy2) TaxID=559515 RepID=M4C715_HYAAE